MDLGRNTSVSAESARTQRKLDWSDAIRPTIVAGLSLGAAVIVVLPLLLGGLRRLQNATRNPEIKLLPIIAFAVLFTVISFVGLRKKARGREFENSYMFPPAAVVLCALIVCIIISGDTEADVQADQQALMDTQAFRARLNDPKFLKTLKPPLPTTALAVLREELVDANPQNSKLTAKQIHFLLKNFGGDLEDAIGESPKTAPDDLEWVAKHCSVPGRKAVAMNAATPEPIVRRLLSDSNAEVVLAAEHNAARRVCDGALLQTIWERTRNSNLPADDNLFLLLARNACTPRGVLSALSRYPGDVGRIAQGTLAGR